MTKPGYGIVSDCIGARTRLVYTERGDFPEYPIMVAEMPRYLPAVHVSNDALRAGRIAGGGRAKPWRRPFPSRRAGTARAWRRSGSWRGSEAQIPSSSNPVIA